MSKTPTRPHEGGSYFRKKPSDVPARVQPEKPTPDAAPPAPKAEASSTPSTAKTGAPNSSKE